jgi:hypothetical protein
LAGEPHSRERKALMGDAKQTQAAEAGTPQATGAPVVIDELDDLKPTEEQLADVKGGRNGGGPPGFS